MIDILRIIAIGLVFFGIGYLMPVKSPFDKDCPQPKPVSNTVVHDSSEVDALPISIVHITENIKPRESWAYTGVEQDTIDGHVVDIIEKEKTWTYVDTTKDSTKEYYINGITEVVITGLVDDSIEVDVLQNIEIDPRPFYTPIDSIYSLQTIEKPAKPESPTVLESPLFWGAISFLGGLVSALLINKKKVIE